MNAVGFVLISYFPLRSVFTNIYVCVYFFCLIFALSLRNFLFDILFLGMSRALLESVRIPCSKSTTKEWYNVVLLEKLLHILYSACQYGLFQKIILFQSQSRNSDPTKKLYLLDFCYFIIFL